MSISKCIKNKHICSWLSDSAFFFFLHNKDCKKYFIPLQEHDNEESQSNFPKRARCLNDDTRDETARCALDAQRIQFSLNDDILLAVQSSQVQPGDQSESWSEHNEGMELTVPTSLFPEATATTPTVSDGVPVM